MNLYRPTWHESSFDRMFLQVADDLAHAPSVNTGHWQAKKDVPMVRTRELMTTTFEVPIAGSPGAWASYMKPNLPWAEDHFLERVGGKPLNPPPSHEYWPFNQDGNKDHMDGEAFSHSYPERLWPRYAPIKVDRLKRAAGSTGTKTPNRGIRYEYGDLGHAVMLLLQEPTTRQCFIPLWFPEDLCAAAVHHQRVPCTLGYHVMMRNNLLNVFYPMRSLDWLRYGRDDFYMAGRLTHWIIDQCRGQVGENSIWHDVEPGMLTVHAVSLHCFEDDVQLIRAMKNKARPKEGASA